MKAIWAVNAILGTGQFLGLQYFNYEELAAAGIECQHAAFLTLAPITLELIQESPQTHQRLTNLAAAVGCRRTVP